MRLHIREQGEQEASGKTHSYLSSLQTHTDHIFKLHRSVECAPQERHARAYSPRILPRPSGWLHAPAKCQMRIAAASSCIMKIERPRANWRRARAHVWINDAREHVFNSCRLINCHTRHERANQFRIRMRIAIRVAFDAFWPRAPANSRNDAWIMLPAMAKKPRRVNSSSVCVRCVDNLYWSAAADRWEQSMRLPAYLVKLLICMAMNFKWALVNLVNSIGCVWH